MSPLIHMGQINGHAQSNISSLYLVLCLLQFGALDLVFGPSLIFLSVCVDQRNFFVFFQSEPKFVFLLKFERKLLI